MYFGRVMLGHYKRTPLWVSSDHAFARVAKHFRIDKKGKREFLEHQMAANRERDMRQQSYDNAEKMTKDWQNVGLNGAHKLQQTLDKQSNAQQVSVL